MSLLAKEDLECFKCCLEDCKDKAVGCKRLQLIREEKQYKDLTFRRKMTSILSLRQPIVVR